MTTCACGGSCSCQTSNINEGYLTYKQTPNAILLDVREPEEYATGFIKDAVNFPLSRFDGVLTTIENKDIPLFVYCHSGMRSGKAKDYLEANGYTNVTNIGGIVDWDGPLE